MGFSDFGKTFVFFGVILIILGIFFVIFEKVPFLGKLPGDIIIKKENFIFYFPLVSMILLSIVLTIILNIFFRK